MKLANVHQRTFAATPEQLTAHLADLDAIWPTHITPAPRPQGELLRASPMLWQEFPRPGAVRAFRVVAPTGIRGEHWFDLRRVEEGAVLRHTIDGEASGPYEAIWREQIEPVHDRVLEALFDNLERVLGGRRADGLPRDSRRCR